MIHNRLTILGQAAVLIIQTMNRKHNTQVKLSTAMTLLRDSGEFYNPELRSAYQIVLDSGVLTEA